MKQLEYYFSHKWLVIILRSFTLEILLTFFFIYFGNSWNSKLWSEPERQYYAVFTIIQILLNLGLWYLEFAKELELKEIE